MSSNDPLELGQEVDVRIKIDRGCYWQRGIIDRLETQGMYRVEFITNIGERKTTHGWYKRKDIKSR